MTNWPVKTLGEVSELFTGGTPSTGNKSYYDGGQIKWLRSGDVHQREIYDCEGRITEEGMRNANTRYLPLNSVLIALAGQGKTRGTVAMLRTQATCNQSVVSIMPIDPKILLPEFVFWNLHMKYDEIRRMTGDDGNDRRGLNMRLIRSMTVPIAPLEEQKRIVTLLDDATARITELTTCYEQARTNANNLYESACQTEFDDQRSKSPTVTLPDISENLDGRRKPITKSDREAGDIPYYGASGIVDYVKGYLFDERTLLISEDGANLLARSTPIAFTAEGKYWVNNHAHVVKFEEIVTQTYVEMFLNSIPIDNWVTGAAQPKLTQAALNRIPIPLPSLEEQRRIVARLDQMRAKTAEMVATYGAKLQAAKNLRQSILEAAFTGEL
jgi:restriction endonuclease S subunit